MVLGMDDLVKRLIYFGQQHKGPIVKLKTSLRNHMEQVGNTKIPKFSKSCMDQVMDKVPGKSLPVTRNSQGMRLPQAGYHAQLIVVVSYENWRTSPTKSIGVNPFWVSSIFNFVPIYYQFLSLRKYVKWMYKDRLFSSMMEALMMLSSRNPDGYEKIGAMRAEGDTQSCK